MARTGIDNPWRPEDEPDREPEPVEEWVEAGIDQAEAEVWRRWRFRLGAAMAWRAAAVLDGLRAAQWATAGATPETVNRWRAAAIDATEAVAWHEMGFTIEDARRHKANGLTAEEAFRRAPGRGSGRPFAHQVVPPSGPLGGPMNKFAEAGVPPRILQSYVTRKWLDEEAVAWAREEIDAAEAPVWKALGLRPNEAGRLVRKGSSVAEIMHDWWQAGVPIGEVADWIGAGLAAEEAAAQRAKGITAEQAATLRALREDPSL